MQALVFRRDSFFALNMARMQHGISEYSVIGLGLQAEGKSVDIPLSL